MIFDVFQKGLILGSAQLPFDPSKRYAYAEHPTEGWRVYLRSAIFLHAINEPFNSKRFLVVKQTGTPYSSATWEPPKGQMEGKDIHGRNVLPLLKENVRRETEEESHITHIMNLQHTGLVFQHREKDYPPNHFFQYHIFQGFLTPSQSSQSFDKFQWIKEHPKGFQRMKRDRREKDEVAWFDPRRTRLNPRWTPDIVAMYLSAFEQYSI
jgi:8-oxo-dGTP pyrophosphatase MutT (NUDIX family)